MPTVIPPPGVAPGPIPQATQGTPGQPPSGSPVTMPNANLGNEAKGMALLKVAVGLLEHALPLMGTASEAGKDLLAALPRLAKHVPAQSMSPGVENSALMTAMLQRKQDNPMMAFLARGQGAAPGGQPPAAGGAQPPVPQAA